MAVKEKAILIKLKGKKFARHNKSFGWVQHRFMGSLEHPPTGMGSPKVVLGKK